MRALVVGASGQVGGALLQALRGRGHAVTGTYATVPVDGALPVDLTDDRALEQLVNSTRPDWIFCPAGQTHVDWCEDHPEEAARANVAGPLVLARAGALLGSGFVYYSTDYVFDGKAGPYGEETPPHPISTYGKTKLEGERAVLGETPRAIVIRSVMVYGPERQGKNSVYQILRRIRAGETVRVPADQISTPTYNADLAEASVVLAEREARGLFHIAGSSLLGRLAFARMVCEVFGLDSSRVEAVSTACLTQRAPRPLRGGLRIAKSRAFVDTEFRSVEAGLQAMRAALEAGAADRDAVATT